MEHGTSVKGNGRIIGILSICLPLVILLLILNWFFGITPYQNLQGLPLLIAPFISLIGFALGYMSFRKSTNNLAKWGMVINVILFVSPFLYWTVGTLVFGP